MDIRQFKATFETGGVLKTNSYVAKLSFPLNHYMSLSPEFSKELAFRCESATLPGISLATIDHVTPVGYGPLQSFPYSAMFDPVNLIFTVDKDGRIHKFFKEWNESIVFANTAEAGLNTQRTGSEHMSYEVGYKSKYSCIVEIEVYNESDEKTMTAVMNAAFPKSISQLDMSWEQQNQLVKLQVHFSYTDFHMRYERA